MSIRSRIEDAITLVAAGRHEGALLSTLVAVAATSRRRLPKSTKSKRNPRKKMGDGEAFESFLHDEMIKICRVENYNVLFRGKMHLLEHVFYKWLRCELAHKGELPLDVVFEPQKNTGSISVSIDSKSGICLSHGWLDGLACAVVNAPENTDQFGDPPKVPLPLHLPGFNVTINNST